MTTDFNGRMPAAGVQPPEAISQPPLAGDQPNGAPTTHNAATSRAAGRVRRTRYPVDPDRRCASTTLKGERCPNRSLAGRQPPTCFHHVPAQVDPQLAERRDLARQLGGYRATIRQLPEGFPKADFASPDGVRALLEATANGVLSGCLHEPSVGDQPALECRLEVGRGPVVVEGGGVGAGDRRSRAGTAMSTTGERIARLEARLAKLRKPIVIERRSFSRCQACGAGDEVGERIVGRPCPGCGVVIERPATWHQDRQTPPGSTLRPASTVEALLTRCPACTAVVAPDARFCPYCGVRRPETQSNPEHVAGGTDARDNTPGS